MNWLKDYMLHLCTAAVLGGLLTALSPGKRFEKPFKLIVSFFMLIIILSPFARLNRLAPDFLPDEWRGADTQSEEKLKERLWEDTARLTEKALSGSVSRTVRDEFGILPLSVKAEVSNRSGGILLEGLTVVLNRKDAALSPEIKEALKKSFGIEAKVISE